MKAEMDYILEIRAGNIPDSVEARALCIALDALDRVTERFGWFLDPWALLQNSEEILSAEVSS